MNFVHFLHRRVASTVGAIGFTLTSLCLAQDAAQPPDMPSEELPAGAEVLSRGPVHEAFAKPVTMIPEAPLVVPQAPPENLAEMPPAERPVGADVVWVPGYWAWDTERNDFIWVTGCWRNAPPNTYWVPGHWLAVDTGWEWIGGFWKTITAQPQQEIEYLPAPPAAIELDPPGPPPLPDQIWVPGCWYWYQNHYLVRHGYWMKQYVGWVWVPSHYAWTPRGFIFVHGHWDHDLDNRGVLFCPEYFPHAVRVRAGFVVSPGFCVDLGMLRLNLFVSPNYRHYLFGDYYEQVDGRRGIFPWYRCQTERAWYDPLFVYDRWRFRQSDPHWAAEQAHEFELRRTTRDLRPARTYRELQAQITRLPENRRPERPLVQSVRTYAASQETPARFERLSPVERRQISASAAEVRSLRNQRNQWEAPQPPPRGAARTPATGTSAPFNRSSPGTRPSTLSTGGSRPTTAIPSRQVRVTRPERVPIPNQPHLVPSTESRFIEKQPPRRPVQEETRTAANPGTQPSRVDSRTRPPSSLETNGKDRQR